MGHVETYRARQEEHERARKGDLTKDGMEGQYSEVADDADWLWRDATGFGWGGDDSHNDMLNFCPTDACLIEWRCGPGRARWAERGERYLAGECPPYGRLILDRVAGLDERFARFGRVK